MKVSIFASTVFAMTAWVSYANAEDIVPESTATLKECQAWAASHQGTALYAHANKRCEELRNCVDNESTGQLQLRACMAQAESQFYNAVNLLQPQTRPQAQLDQTHRLEKDAITNAANSDYNLLGEGKGFRNNNQGSN